MKNLFTGFTVPQQYVCLSLEDFENPPSVFLTASNSDKSLDVTTTHIFLGYRPLIMAVVFSDGEDPLEKEELICLNFMQNGSKIRNSWRSFSSFKNCLARLVLKRISGRNMERQRVVLYGGTYGEHHFINPFYRFINSQREKLRKDHPGNVRLPGNLYDQVRIAYAIPRIIALITVCDGSQMNMFPTDLHGGFGKEFYISSLRQGGKANNQVEEAKKLILSFMPVSEYKAVYAMGKNHMQNMRDFNEFSISPELTDALKLPVPSAALRYKELELIDSFNAGIHRIHFYRIIRERKITDGLTLAHIHQYYAQWRIDHKFPVNIRLR